jgi:hypothetical protein
VVDENISHRLGGDGEKVGAVVERHRLSAQHANAELVHERVWLECVVAALPLQEARGNLPQLRVDDSKQVVAGGFIALAPVAEPACDLLRKRRLHDARHDTGTQSCPPSDVGGAEVRRCE